MSFAISFKEAFIIFVVGYYLGKNQTDLLVFKILGSVSKEKSWASLPTARLSQPGPF